MCTAQHAHRVLVVPDPSQLDSSAESVPRGHVREGDGGAERILPTRASKLRRRILVDAEHSSEPARDPHLDIRDSPGGSDSESGTGSGRGSRSDAQGGDTTSNVVTVSTFDPEAAAPALPLQKKVPQDGPALFTELVPAASPCCRQC